MSWFLNLWMLGKGAPPDFVAFTQHACNGTMGMRYSITAKTGSTRATYYYRLFLGGWGP